jgi:TRAP-type mannitol/chloroaromatic compound transport system permease small subunit
MSHICANDEYRSQVRATNRPENIVIRYIFEFESNRRFQFSFKNFSLVYRSAFAQISKVTAHERIQHLYQSLLLLNILVLGKTSLETF